MKWKGILFDLDGTLVDTSEGVKHAIQHTIKEMRLYELPDEEIQKFIGPPIYESFRNEYGLDDSDVSRATEIFRNTYRTEYLFEATVYDGMVNLLHELREKKYKLGVATNKRIDYTITLLDHLKLSECFDCIIGSDFQNTMKKREIVLACMDELCLQREDTVLIGDTIHDFNGAKQCGIDFLAVTYGFGFHTIEEKRVISDIPFFDDVSDLGAFLGVCIS